MVSSCITRLFWERTCSTRVRLKYIESWLKFWHFLKKITSWTCLLGSGLKFTFHCIAQSLILLRSLLKLFADVLCGYLMDFRKKGVSSPNTSTFVIKTSQRSRAIIFQVSSLEASLLQYWAMKSIVHLKQLFVSLSIKNH